MKHKITFDNNSIIKKSKKLHNDDLFLNFLTSYTRNLRQLYLLKKLHIYCITIILNAVYNNKYSYKY